MRCPHCDAVLAEGGRFCPSCGRALDTSHDPTVLSGADVTRLATPEQASAPRTPLTPRTPRSGGSSPVSGSGWLTSSGAIDHGRFEPGAVVDGRYRIVALIGRGGMGEVYRADDLRLGQAVALKRLPERLSREPARLAQFHNEVRTARHVSHPNVCRVYDIGDVDGELYLSMEYVDGEDLSALLRRIGRLPEDKALDIARQIAAGLAAAHERGVLHRDLKPANIMLDSAGKVRIMDFSLAAIGDVADVRAGTPGYMAPEQLEGREVTVRSDIYSMGLVLYELFTGRRAFDAKTIAELVEQHQSGSITSPTEVVKTLDPSIGRAIMRCLNPDPAARPASALAVSASLPGGDPLAAALAAGETPSPEMVAAAGTDASALSPALAAAWTAFCLVMLVAAAVLSDRSTLLAHTPFDLAPSTLLDRARDLERRFVPNAPVADRASGFAARLEFLTWLRRHDGVSDELRILAGGRPAALVYWYRSSPDWLAPDGNAVGLADPSPLQPGMTTLTVDLEGRLAGFLHVPPQFAADTPPAPLDWHALFDAAGLDAARFAPAPSQFTPRVFADTRMAWTGTVAEMPDAPLRVEAAFRLGQPVSFQVLGPWQLPATGEAAPVSRATLMIGVIATVVVVPGLLLAAAMVARANVRRGRGDRRGATRIAAAVFVVGIGGWLFIAHHPFDAGLEQARLFKAVASALFDAAEMWLFYLAAEPQVRRIWPHILITWSRLLAGSFRDPMVGRDMVIGAACGVVMTVVSSVYYLVPGWFGWPTFGLHITELYRLLGTRYVIATFFLTLSNALQNAMLGVLGLALLRRVLGRVWLVFCVATAMFSFLAARGQFESGTPAVDLAFGVLLVALILGVLFRYGLFAGIVAFFTHFWTYGFVLTVNPDRQYFQTSLAVMIVVAVVALSGFVLSRGDEPWFGRVIAD